MGGGPSSFTKNYTALILFMQGSYLFQFLYHDPQQNWYLLNQIRYMCRWEQVYFLQEGDMRGFLCFTGHRQERETYGMIYFQKPCKRLMPLIHTEFLQLNMIKRQKVGKGLRHFSKEDSQMAIKYIKKIFTITKHWGNSSHIHNEIPPHIHQDVVTVVKCLD